MLGLNIAGNNNLFVVIVQGVESVEEGFLCFCFTLQELDVVDEKNVDIAVTGLECSTTVIRNGVNEVVRELFATDITNTNGRLQALGVVTDGVKQVSLTQT